MTAYEVGDAVEVEYMGVRQIGLVVSVHQFSSNGQRLNEPYYRLSLTNELSHPAYREIEILGRADGR